VIADLIKQACERFATTAVLIRVVRTVGDEIDTAALGFQ